MAIGDQFHVAGSTDTQFQPSSGVEVVVKTFSMGWYNSSNYFWCYPRQGGNSFTMAPVGGASYTHHTKSQSGFNDSDNPMYRGSWSHPVNNSYYMQVSEEGGSHFHIAAYVTKDQEQKDAKML